MNPARALAALVLLSVAAVPAAAADIDTLRANVIDYYSSAGADRGSPLMAAALAELEVEAAAVTAEGFLLGNGSWADIDYAAVPSGVWSPWDHFRRLTIMAKAYRTDGQAFHGDPVMLEMIERSLLFVDTFYGPGRKTPGNWWFWTIGPALDLGPTLVLVEQDVSPAVLNTAKAVLEARVGRRPGFDDDGDILTGQNRVWSAMNHMMVAILNRDESLMTQVRNAVTLELVPLPLGGDGLKSDYSFHQHGPQLYTGGYGGSFGYEVSKYLLFSRETPWAPSQTIDRHVHNFVADGIAWSLYGEYFDASVIGREIAYPTATGFNGFASLLHMSRVSSSRQAEIRSSAAMMLASWDAPLRPELAAIAVSLVDTDAAWPAGNRHYPESDFVIHRRPGWYSSVRMFSSRTLSGESVNDENLVGSRQSDGFFYLAVDGDEFFAPEVRPTLDWRRLPGITVEQWPGSANRDFGRGRRDFVGAVTNGRTGTAAMQLAPVESELSARKAWVFLDDSIVFLTNGVTCLTGNPAETVIDQRVVRSEVPLIIDGVPFTDRAIEGDFGWAAGEGVGYYFPDTGVVKVREETRYGSWVMLALSNPQGSMSKRVRALWFDHGSSVTDGRAEYVVVPNVDAAQMQAWAEDAPVTILRNDEVVSAARDERTGEVGLVFWQAGSESGMTVDRPSIVHRTDDGETVTLSVADPARAGARIRITIPESLRLVSGNAYVRLETRTTTLDVPVSAGRTSTLVLSRSWRERAVRR